MTDIRSVTLPRSSSPHHYHIHQETNFQRNSSTTTSRPASFYDNYHTARENGSHGTPKHREIRFERDRSPTQAPLLNTTVPQSITGVNIAGRHTPTRNSLRHSRMIVMSRTGTVPRKSLPRVFRFYKLARALVGLQTLLGAALCFLSVWLFLWTPNIRQRDNPYWSGLPLLLSGILGLVLLYCCRKEYPGMKRGQCVYGTKIFSVFLSSWAAAACFVCCVFALLHLVSLSTMTCTPPLQLNATCFCKIENPENATIAPIKSYHYVDLSCPEVDNILSILLIFSCATNAIAGVLATWYVYLHWASRYQYAYSEVKTKENAPIVFSNT